MRVHRKKLLYYSFFLFFIMACRTYACSAPQLATTSDNTADSVFFTCQRFAHLGEGPGTSGNTCTIPCPDGSNHTFDIFGDVTIFASMTLGEAQAQYCPGGASVQPASNEPQPTEEPTEVSAPPTDAPTEAAPVKPFLTGSFTTCDNAAGYVNFSIAEGAPAYDPASFKLVFNGQVAKCAPASNNSSVLTCNYPPAPYGPPAYIQVYIGDQLVNDFKFPGGEICNVVQPPNNNNTESTEESQSPSSTEPAPTEDTGGD